MLLILKIVIDVVNSKNKKKSFIKMEYIASMKDIPFEDINSYLYDNGVPLPTNKLEAYSLARDLIESGLTDEVPESIADWIVARKLKKEYNFDHYKISEIIQSSDDDLIDLSNIMLLDRVDKYRIIRMLKYLDKLDNDLPLFDKLPDELLLNILNKLDYNSFILMCDMSPRFNKICKSKNFKPSLEERIQYVINRKDIQSIKEIHRDMEVDKLNTERTSFKNPSYTLTELQEWARLLKLPSSGNKSQLVETILNDRYKIGL